MNPAPIKFLSALALVASATLVGCSSTPSAAVAELETIGEPSTQPSNAAVTANDFEQLWSAADETARALKFTTGRQDRRAGVYSTEPMTSSQWFEPWRTELKSADAVIQSSLATVRRTIRVEFTRNADGSFTAQPRVLVERYAQAERRITSSARYKTLYTDTRIRSYGTPESDAGVLLPNQYWYPIGNDPDLERYVAAKMQQRIES